MRPRFLHVTSPFSTQAAHGRLDVQNFSQEATRVAFGNLRNLLGRTRGHNGTTARASFGSEVNQSVGGLNNVKIMLNDKHRIPRIDKTLQNIKKLPHIFHMQARGGLVENVERFTRLTTLQLA